jgi:hypothetical protein
LTAWPSILLLTIYQLVLFETNKNKIFHKKIAEHLKSANLNNLFTQSGRFGWTSLIFRVWLDNDLAALIRRSMTAQATPVDLALTTALF